MGVIVYKTVGNRKIEKRVNLRVEHVRHSKCRDDFLNRVKTNAAAKRAAKERGGMYFAPLTIQSTSTSSASPPSRATATPSRPTRTCP